MEIELHQFTTPWDLPNPSPFCLKVETFLRLAELDYTVCPWTPLAAPLGKAPFLRLDGELVADSSTILETLLARTDGALDRHASAQQLAAVHAVVRMLEEHTYWGLLCLRWLDDEAWSTYRWVIGQAVPALVRRPMTAWMRRGVRRAAHAHGLGRHSKDEVLRRVHRDLDAVEAVLQHPFLLGEHPCSSDASVYAFLEALAHPLGTAALQDRFAPGTPLRAYLDVMRTRAWPAWTFA